MNDRKKKNCQIFVFAHTIDSFIKRKTLLFINMGEGWGREIYGCKYNVHTALSYYHMRIVFVGMSSWTPSTMYPGMKTTFENKYIKANMLNRTFITRI